MNASSRGGACSCTASTSWNGAFGQFTSGTTFCQQNFGGQNPWITGGGGAAAGGGWSGLEPCESGQYSVSASDGWRIDVPRSLAKGVIPYRAFAYAQFCNGRPYTECWAGQEKVSFSFSFKMEGANDIGAYVKLLFWTDSGNILGLLPPQHPNGEGHFRLIAFMTTDYPNSWSQELQIQDQSWYHVQVDFTPASQGVAIRVNGAGFAHGTIPVDMLEATNGPQIGVYSFDFGGGQWPEEGFKLWLDDVCVGEVSGTCPSSGGPSPSTTPPAPAPATTTKASQVCTAEDADPYDTGGEVHCCDGLQSCLRLVRPRCMALPL